MLIDAVQMLEAPGVEATLLEPDDDLTPFDALLELVVDGNRRVFAVDYKKRAPFPSEIDQFLQRYRVPRGMTPMLAAPRVPAAVGDRLAAEGWSWIDETGNHDIRASRMRLKQRMGPTVSSPVVARQIPQGVGALKIIRFLISHADGPLMATHLANVAGVTQPRASQVLARLGRLGLAEKTREGWIPHRAPLLDAFLESYRGPGGSESHFYSLDEPSYTAMNLTRANRVGVYVSADVGPDLLAPWRRPTHLIVYAKRRISFPEESVVRAQGSSDANVIVRVPDDSSVFCFVDHRATANGVDLRLVEHTQMVWDLLTLGGDDREEAARGLRQWILENP